MSDTQQSPVAEVESPASSSGVQQTATQSPGSALPKKKRVETGPRSRTGCARCKARKKKCTEVYIDGACTRCLKGGFICTQDQIRPSRARRGTSSLPPGDASSSSAPIRSLASTSLLQGVSFISHVSPTHYTHAAAPSAGAHTSPAYATSASLLPAPNPPPHQGPSPPNPIPSVLLPPPNPLLYPMQAMSDNPSAFPFADFDADLSLFDLLGAVDAGAGSGLDFLPALVGPLDMEEPTPNLAGSLANDLEDALGWEKGLLASGTGADTLVEVRNFASQWWTFYRSLNNSYFFSIPPKARDVVNDRMRDLVMGPDNDLGRAAISSWCASHYSSVLLREGASDFDEWDAKAARYYQQCLSLLYDTSVSLVVRVGAILDMRLAQINRHGAAPVRFLELAGEAFMKQELGNFPELNFAKSARIEDLAVRCFAYKDVWRAVCTRRSTLLKLSNTPDPRPPALVEDQSIVDRRTLSLHLGLPVDLLLCFADTANLIVEASTLAPHIVQQRGLVIKARIEGWAPDATLAREASNDSASYITDLASQEMWRHAASIYLHSSLFRLGPLATPLRAALTQIVKLSASLTEPAVEAPTIFLETARCPIYFLAATIATTPDDREVCRDGLLACGPGKAFVDNHKAVERLWEETDRSGVVPEWGTFLEKEGLAVCFL